MSENEPKKPDWKLVQEKAYYVYRDGARERRTKTVNHTVGWNEISKDGKEEYVSFADSVIDITPDVDGRVKLVLFKAKPKDEKKPKA